MPIAERVKKVIGSSTLAITSRAEELRKNGHDIVNFAAGEPDFDTPEFIKKAAIEAIDKGQTKYTPSVGTLSLRQAIAKKFLIDNDLVYDPLYNIVVSCGAKHSLYNAIQVLVENKDEVLIPCPYWVSYPEMVKLAGAIPKFLETSASNSFKVTAKQIEENISINTKVLILNSPSNPTGVVYNKSELESIAEVCVKRNIMVISDEIYEKLYYEEKPYISIASLGKEIYDLTVTINGVSKSHAMTGWRIGYLGASKEISEYIKKTQDHSTSNPSSIAQAAALAALTGPQECLLNMKKEFQRRRDIMVEHLDKIPKVSYVYPKGAFYVFCDISKLNESSSSLAKKILDEINVACIPGDGFGADQYIRLSFATSADRIKEGLNRISEWIQKNY